jgi:hypothetical protein
LFTVAAGLKLQAVEIVQPGTTQLKYSQEPSLYKAEGSKLQAVLSVQPKAKQLKKSQGPSWL